MLASSLRLVVIMHSEIVEMMRTVRVVTDGAHVGIQGATYLTSKFIDLKKLGSTDGQPTFSWETLGKVYACLKQWSKEHVHDLQ